MDDSDEENEEAEEEEEVRLFQEEAETGERAKRTMHPDSDKSDGGGQRVVDNYL